jgi:hypothetical protein
MSSRSKGAKETVKLTVAQAAAHVQLSKQYLHQLRFYNDGPPFKKNGRRIEYDQASLDTWNNERLAANEARRTQAHARRVAKNNGRGAPAPKRKASPRKKAA